MQNNNLTIVIQIGNSDDKLPQYAWSEFVQQLGAVVDSYVREVHFSGGSDTAARWQNFCIIAECREDQLAKLKRDVKRLREIYQQDSLAWIEGSVEFI